MRNDGLCCQNQGRNDADRIQRLASPATRELLRPHLPLDFSGFPGLPPIRAAAQADALVQVPDSGFVTRLDRCGNLPSHAAARARAAARVPWAG